ncbi:hypothetical protein SDC9_196666 [bioreactor metagenome]|uniref:Uncharacterized protein n=1 Tax=bioreactor metagenome TaxID=1076179 RepID=A0A645IP85_9ZZZZ
MAEHGIVGEYLAVGDGKREVAKLRGGNFKVALQAAPRCRRRAHNHLVNHRAVVIHHFPGAVLHKRYVGHIAGFQGVRNGLGVYGVRGVAVGYIQGKTAEV